MAKSNKPEEEIRAEVEDIDVDPHEGDRGEAKREGKKPKKPTVEEEGCISQNEGNDVKRFISQVSRKNYAEANKYLQAALESKMKQRIVSTQHKLGF